MSEYMGFKEVVMSDAELGEFYSRQNENTCELLLNEYLILRRPNGEVVDQLRWTGHGHAKVPFKQINSRMLGKIKPRNIQQQLAIDMLYNPESTVKVLTGGFGVGKDMLMTAVAVDLIEKGKFDRIVWVRNNIEVKNSKPIGHLPGGYIEKLMPYAGPLVDHVGGQDQLELLINQGRVELVHLGFIRGRDIKNAIIICSEAENMTKEHIQLLLGRVGEGSMLWLNGDYRQTDGDIFRKNNGLVKTIDTLKGHHLFGFVKLLKIERSETAALADILDEVE